ncbi:Glycine-rich RNA-binding protein 2, mitochondrial [Meyerozyma guilliermondii]
MTSVYVSGASGFIAQHIVKQLIEKNYKVVGSVRSTEKGDSLVKHFGPDFKYEIVRDIAAEDAFAESLKNHPEVTIFIHTASPVTFTSDDVENDILNPAQRGTVNALQGIAKYAPQIKKVVITSSYAAIWDLSKDLSDPDRLVTEENWNPVTPTEAKSSALMAYCASKTFAERAAWNFVRRTKPNFTLSTVLPSYVFGPQAFEVKDTLNLSSELVQNFLKLKPTDSLPDLNGSFVDVRDTAAAHLVAFENDEAANQRLVLAAHQFIAQEIADIIHKRFPDKSRNVPIGTPGQKAPVELWSKKNFSKTEKLLGFKYISMEQSVVDAIDQILNK